MKQLIYNKLEHINNILDNRYSILKKEWLIKKKLNKKINNINDKEFLHNISSKTLKFDINNIVPSKEEVSTDLKSKYKDLKNLVKSQKTYITEWTNILKEKDSEIQAYENKEKDYQKEIKNKNKKINELINQISQIIRNNNKNFDSNRIESPMFESSDQDNENDKLKSKLNFLSQKLNQSNYNN